MSAADAPLLQVDRLRVAFPSPRGVVAAVNDVSLRMDREKVGIVGESGSGNSITARAILRLLPPYADISAKTINFKGENLLDLSEKELRRIRGRQISMVMQDPKYSLNPVRRVG
ncbi:MAG: ATP-binding cassette domain-containing protein, partial [Desulforhopalus sp.]|nr:ATP-binding cassette domain-containing protein [Desulforhopalus sp.]